MNVTMLRAEQAQAALADPAFRREWSRLHHDCPWATVFQSEAFAATWYTVYRERYEPIVIVGTGADGALRGLLLLAMDRERRQVVCAGTHHAEYHTWLAAPSDGDEFLAAALETLAAGRARGSLRFLFLAPGTPLTGITRGARRGARFSLRPYSRPLMDLGDPEAIEASLRKKSNKSRLARLKRLGPLRLTQFHSAAELAPFFDEIVAQCDLRQGAVNHSTPFRSDPCKAPLYLALMDQPGVFHATSLFIGDEPVATHIGAASGSSVALGLIVHSPTRAADSPGKMLILLLGQLLAQQGYTTFDLTPPAGDYKDRYATRFDTVYALEVFITGRSYLLHLGRRALGAAARAAFRLVGARGGGPRAFAAGLLGRLSGRSLRRWPAAAFAALRRNAWSTRRFLIYRVRSDQARATEPTVGFRRNSQDDLLRYAPADAAAPTEWEFWSRALARMEEGQVAYTLVENGALVHTSWLVPHTAVVATAEGHRLRVPEGSACLGSDLTRADAEDRSLERQAILARLRDVAAAGPPRSVYAAVEAGRADARRSHEECGFEACGSAWVRRRFGRERRWLDGECEAAPAEAPA